MNQEQCGEILKDHFEYEFEAAHMLDDGFDLDTEVFDEDGESVGTKRSYRDDAWGWLPEGLMDEHADKDSVEWACWVWYHNLFD